MDFPGWSQDDFAVFSTPDFDGRMTLLRERIQPRLDALGQALVPRLEAETGTEWFHHVARHLRRSVNPPTDTWVAFNRVKRGYKATIHFDIGISARGANVCLVVKPECTERDAFARALEQNAERWRALYQEAEGLVIGDVPNAPLEDLLPAREALTDAWLQRAEWLRKRKQFEFEAGYRLAPNEAAALAPAAFLDECFRRLRALLPLYMAGVGG
jgi:uncharacterized protein YktB (UPF0637 family)